MSEPPSTGGPAYTEDRYFDLSIDLLCKLGFDGYFRQLNPAWEEALGFTRKELMSKPFIEFVHPDDREATLEENRRVQAGGKALQFENRYLCKDGSLRWFLYPVARDITLRKEADEERDRLVRELQSALAEVKFLREYLPICSYCRKLRDDEDY